MKKTLAAALAAIVMAASFAGCSDNKEPVSDPNSSTTSDSSPSSAGLTLTASEMAERALGYNTNNWSMAMMLVDDETLSILLPDLNADMFEDYCFYSDAIGINGHEVFVGKPKAGQEDAVKAAFEKSLNALKEQVSFYPAGQASVAGAVSGTTSHGYEYFIIHPDGEGAAAAMVDPNAPVVDFENRGEPGGGEGDGGDDESGLALPYNGAGDMVRTALAVNPESWTEDMVAATDEELPKILKNDLHAEMFKEYCLVYDVFGDCGQTVFAGKPQAGQEDTAKAALENAFNERKAEVAIFPNGAACSENAVFGTSSDGYIYFVFHADGAAVADAMTVSVF